MSEADEIERLKGMLRYALIHAGADQLERDNLSADNASLRARIEDLRYELDKTEAENRRLRADIERLGGGNQ
jgi:cell division protein FtsB